MNYLNAPKQTSVPSVSTFNNMTNYATSSHTSVTHPSARSREYLDNIFKKISSGDNVLSRFPTRLDFNVEFSDDDEEDDGPIETPDKPITSIKHDGKEKKEIMKTPELPPVSRSLFNNTIDMHNQYVHKTGRGNEHFHPSSSKVSVSANHKVTNIKEPHSSEKYVKSDFINTNKNVAKILQGTSNGLAKKNLNSIIEPIPRQMFNSPYEPTIKNAIHPSRSSSLSGDIIEVNGKIYNVLSLLGSGGSCKVYSVHDSESKSLFAIKRVNFSNTDASICEGYKQEIEYLKKLQDSDRVIKMFDFEYRENELLLVLEHGDIDFAKYISNQAKLKRLKPLTIKFYWQQMLEAVADIHKYGIVHSDLKPANFLLVNGHLKLIDFGIATSVPEDKTSTFRDTQVGTLNYMSPEAINQMSNDVKNPRLFKVGVKSDVWSLGCILYNLVYGVTPFHSINDVMKKIIAIVNPNYEIPFKPLPDPLLLDVLKRCLKRDTKERASVEELLRHPYLVKDSESSTNASKPNTDLNNILEQMQNLTPRRMRYVTQVVQQLADKTNT